jgi:hypothetical protein
VVVNGVAAGVERSTTGEEFAAADSRFDLTSEQPAVASKKQKTVGAIILMLAFIYRHARLCQAKLVEYCGAWLSRDLFRSFVA